MRRLQHRRHSTPVVVERLSHFQQHEIGDLRRRERAHEECHVVADFVSNRLVDVDDISNAQKMTIYRAAIEHFANRLPPQVTRVFVDAAIRAELSARAEVAALRRKKAGSAKTAAMVS